MFWYTQVVRNEAELLDSGTTDGVREGVSSMSVLGNHHAVGRIAVSVEHHLGSDIDAPRIDGGTGMEGIRCVFI